MCDWFYTSDDVMESNSYKDLKTLYQNRICDSEDEWNRICGTNRKRVERLWKKIDKVKNNEPDINLIQNYTVSGNFNFTTGIFVYIWCLVIDANVICLSISHSSLWLSLRMYYWQFIDDWQPMDVVNDLVGENPSDSAG